MPVWVRFSGLHIKYWGKIAGLVEIPLRADRVTSNNEHMIYARVLVEFSMDKVYLAGVMFKNEQGCIVEQRVNYEWKPAMCTHCKTLDIK